jgi:hypothetical protein
MTSNNFLNSGLKVCKIKRTLLSVGKSLVRKARKSCSTISWNTPSRSILIKVNSKERTIGVIALTLLTTKMLAK